MHSRFNAALAALAFNDHCLPISFEQECMAGPHLSLRSGCTSMILVALSELEFKKTKTYEDQQTLFGDGA